MDVISQNEATSLNTGDHIMEKNRIGIIVLFCCAALSAGSALGMKKKKPKKKSIENIQLFNTDLGTQNLIKTITLFKDYLDKPAAIWFRHTMPEKLFSNDVNGFYNNVAALDLNTVSFFLDNVVALRFDDCKNFDIQCLKSISSNNRFLKLKKVMFWGCTITRLTNIITKKFAIALANLVKKTDTVIIQSNQFHLTWEFDKKIRNALKSVKNITIKTSGISSDPCKIVIEKK